MGKKITVKDAQSLKTIYDELTKFKDEINKVKTKDKSAKVIKPIVNSKDVLPDDVDTGGLPSEVEIDKFKDMTYKEVIEEALKAEKEAIFLGLYAIELAPTKDVKELVEITNDENDHSRIYQNILDSLKE